MEVCPFDAKLWTHSIGAHGIVKVQLDLQMFYIFLTQALRGNML
jgi:hypothetical protein